MTVRHLPQHRRHGGLLLVRRAMVVKVVVSGRHGRMLLVRRGMVVKVVVSGSLLPQHRRVAVVVSGGTLLPQHRRVTVVVSGGTLLPQRRRVASGTLLPQHRRVAANGRHSGGMVAVHGRQSGSEWSTKFFSSRWTELLLGLSRCLD